MSRIYFHTFGDDAAELLGSERAYLNQLTRNVMRGVLDLKSLASTESIAKWRAMLRPGHYLLQEQQREPEPQIWMGWLETALAVGSPALQWNGQDIDALALQLNTACLMGNDTLKLAARLHGQCELHAWVAGPHRKWLAAMIEESRKKGIYREDMGWENVVALLRKRDDHSVVTSFSVCEQFPNSSLIKRRKDYDECLCGKRKLVKCVVGTSCFNCGRDTATITEDEWRDYTYKMSDWDRWRRAFNALKAQGQGLELTPEKWSDYYFGNGVSAFDLVASNYKDRLDRLYLT